MPRSKKISNGDVELIVKDADRYENKGIESMAIVSLKMANDQARFAMALVERWGLVVGEPDGEDSAGRSKLRTLSPEELANKATAASAALYEKMDTLGWMIDLPDQAELADMRKSDEEESN